MNNQLYSVKLSVPHEKDFAAELIDAQFTFSYSHVAGFKVNINVSDSVRVREFSVILYRHCAHASNGNIPDMLPAVDFVPPFFNKDGSRVNNDSVRA